MSGEVDSALDTLLSEHVALRERVAELEADNAQLRGAQTELQQAAEAARADLVSTLARAEATEQESAALRTSQQRELARTRAQAERFERAADERREQLALLKERRAELTRVLREQGERLERVQAENKQLQEEQQAVVRHASDQEEERWAREAETQRDLASLRKAKAAFEERVASRDVQLEDQAKQIASLQARVREADERVVELTEEMGAVDELRATVAAQQAKLQTATEALRSAKGRMEVEEDARADVENEAAALRQALQQARAADDAARREVARLETALAQEQLEHQNKAKQVVRATKGLQAMRIKAMDKERELQGRIAQLQDRLEKDQGNRAREAKRQAAMEDAARQLRQRVTFLESRVDAEADAKAEAHRARDAADARAQPLRDEVAQLQRRLQAAHDANAVMADALQLRPGQLADMSSAADTVSQLWDERRPETTTTAAAAAATAPTTTPGNKKQGKPTSKPFRVTVRAGEGKIKALRIEAAEGDDEGEALVNQFQLTTFLKFAARAPAARCVELLTHKLAKVLRAMRDAAQREGTQVRAASAAEERLQSQNSAVVGQLSALSRRLADEQRAKTRLVARLAALQGPASGEVSLEGCALSDADLAALLDAAGPRPLAALRLANNALTEGAEPALRRLLTTRATRLVDVRGNCIAPASVARLLQAISECAHVASVDELRDGRYQATLLGADGVLEVDFRDNLGAPVKPSPSPSPSPERRPYRYATSTDDDSADDSEQATTVVATDDDEDGDFGESLASRIAALEQQLGGGGGGGGDHSRASSVSSSTTAASASVSAVRGKMRPQSARLLRSGSAASTAANSSTSSSRRSSRRRPASARPRSRANTVQHAVASTYSAPVVNRPRHSVAGAEGGGAGRKKRRSSVGDGTWGGNLRREAPKNTHKAHRVVAGELIEASVRSSADLDKILADL